MISLRPESWSTEKRSGFEKMLAGWQTLDAEVVSGKPAAAGESGDAREPGGDEDEAAA